MTVLHWVPRWLPPSEQFVHQVISRSRHAPVVAVRRGVVHPSAFPVARVVRLDRVLPQSFQERRLVAAALALTARRFGASLLHVHHGLEVEGVVGAAHKAGIPLVISVHGHDVTGPVGPALRHALAHADAVVVPSDFLAGKASDAGAQRIRVLPSGVDLAAFPVTPLPAEPVVVFVGRFVEKKGLDVLAAAWPSVLARVPFARLLLLGEGPVRIDVEAERWTPDPARRAAQVREALQRGRVVVTPSRTAADGDSESLLIVNLEAQASGRPVVTTRHGGIPEFVDASSAVLVPEADAVALADALVQVLTVDAPRLAAGGPAVAARFDADRCAAAVDDLYDELLR